MDADEKLRAAVEAQARAVSTGETEFRELADNAPVLMWRAGLDKVCDWFNRPWLEFTGARLQEEVGFGWSQRVHPEDLQQSVDEFVAAFDARRPFSLTYRLRRHDGEYRWIVDRGAPFERDGCFAGYIGSCLDITEMREAQAHQEVLMAELNHRVKNNLNLILSFLSYSAHRAASDEAKGLLQAAITRIHGVAAIQDQLHTDPSGAVDLGRYLPNLARAVLDSEVTGAARLIADTVPVEVTFHQASNLGLIVNELVTNAIKHGAATDRPVRLTLELQGEGQGVLTFADAGPGFSEAVLSRPNASTRKGAGLIDALARRAGARLVRENADGAVVRLTFPLERPPGA